MSIVAIAGSPGALSRSTVLLRHALARLPAAHARVEIALRDLPAVALMGANAADPILRQALDSVAAAQLVVIATPIYKASFSGLLKTFLDLLPQEGLRGKSVLVLGTGGSPAHLLALDYALKPVLASLGARHILDSVYAVDAQVGLEAGHAPSVHDDVTARIDAALADVPRLLETVPMALAA